MDWNRLLALPATVLLLAGAVLALVGAGHLPGVRRHWRERRRIRASLRMLLALAWLLLAAIGAGLGWSLRGYRKLAAETPVAQLQADRLAPQRWAVRLQLADGGVVRTDLAGDAFRVEADVVKWSLPALLAGGAPPVYRLDRLSGRYDDPAQERTDVRTVVPLGSQRRLDLWRLKRRFPQWLPGVDAVYGSGTYLPLVDGGRYTVSFMHSGALLARPADAATARRLQDGAQD